MKSRTFIIKDVPVEIVNNQDIVDIYGGHRFSDIKSELFKGCGIITKTVQKHEKKHLLERYKDVKKLENINYIILTDLELVSILNVGEHNAAVEHELAHIELGHLDGASDDYSLQEEIDADNKTVENGTDPEVLLKALRSLIESMLYMQYRVKVVTEDDILTYRGYKERKANLLALKQSCL